MVKILSVALMNQPGTFAHVAQVLADAGINIEAWTGDTKAEIGVARLLVSDPDKGLKVLQEAGHPVQVLRGVKVDMANEPGRLAEALKTLGREGINVQLAFGSTGGSDRGEAIFFVSDVEAATQALGAE